MTSTEKLKDQVEALTMLLECFMAVVEDMGRTLDDKAGAKNTTPPQRDVTYIVGRRIGLIQREESLV